MDFWHRFSSPGPYFPCATSSGTVPVFDTNTTLDNSAGGASAQNLTPGTSYSCTTPGGSISWNAGAKKLTINGTVYIDGSAYISAGSGTTYSGVGTIVLSGTFAMDNNTVMCANATCDAASWNPNTTALVIVANGDGVGCCGQSQVTAGHSIDIKKGTFQGGLIGNKTIDASVTGTSVIGPMISVNGTCSAGQGSGASYPRSTSPPPGPAASHHRPRPECCSPPGTTRVAENVPLRVRSGGPTPENRSSLITRPCAPDCPFGRRVGCQNDTPSRRERIGITRIVASVLRVRWVTRRRAAAGVAVDAAWRYPAASAAPWGRSGRHCPPRRRPR